MFAILNKSVQKKREYSVRKYKLQTVGERFDLNY